MFIFIRSVMNIMVSTYPKPKIKITEKGTETKIYKKRVNIGGMWIEGFNASPHSLIDIGEAKVKENFGYIRKK